MFRPLQLLLPALLPSWGFFDYIQPSPRIQFQLLNATGQCVQEWQEFRPRPMHLSFATMLRRMLWNAEWNESLFMMSCAERIVEHHTAHSEQEILHCICRDWQQGRLPGPASAVRLQFRLLFVRRQQTQLVHEVRFESQLMDLPAVASTHI